MEYNELRKRQVSGFYRDIEMMQEESSTESYSVTGINEKIQDIEGIKPQKVTRTMQDLHSWRCTLI